MITVSDYHFSYDKSVELTLHMLYIELYYIPFTLSISALPMGGLQAWSWTVEPHTPQQFQCTMATSCNKVTSYHKSFIISWQLPAEYTWPIYKPGRGLLTSEDSYKLYNLDSIDSCAYLMIYGAICWLEIIASQPCQWNQLFCVIRFANLLGFLFLYVSGACFKSRKMHWNKSRRGSQQVANLKLLNPSDVSIWATCKHGWDLLGSLAVYSLWQESSNRPWLETSWACSVGSFFKN